LAARGSVDAPLSGKEKIWYDGRVIWIHLPDDIEEEDEEPDDLWPDLMLCLECLTEKQRFVIESRYGLRGEPLEQTELALLMGVSQPAVARIELRAIEKMRGYAARKGG
jgi:RNA polymerase sigma factor (sigma-70 family)